MQTENARSGESAGASILLGASQAEEVKASGFYTVECIGPEGLVKWTDTFANLVTTVGKNFALDTTLAGSGYTATWYLGLISSTSYTTGPAAGDTAASHGGWTESVNYSNANRPTPSFGSAASGSKATTATAFNMSASDTIKGCFLISNNAKSGTSGTLYSAGLFTGGDKVVSNGDTLNVTYTATLS